MDELRCIESVIPTGLLFSGDARRHEPIKRQRRLSGDGAEPAAALEKNRHWPVMADWVSWRLRQ